VGNLRSEFGCARPLGSPVIRYVRDGRTVGRTDGQKQCLMPPFGTGGGIISDDDDDDDDDDDSVLCCMG